MSTEIIHNFPEVKELWSGIGGHFDSLGQIINEFIDNSISNFEANNPMQKNICIQLKELHENGDVEVIVEDTGTGIKDLNVAFTLGGRKGAESPLNEHGFGLKHALATANPDNDNWAIYTKTEKDAKNKQFRVIRAPYKIGDYEIDVCDANDPKNGWPGTYSHPTGTLVRFVCSREMYRTINKRATVFASIADTLVEDLGFTYANIIQSAKASLTMKIITADGRTQNAPIGALRPTWEQYLAPGQGSETIDLGGGPVLLEYEFGRFNELDSRVQFDNSTSNRHYKHSMQSSGVEIRLNGRIICSNLFYEVWGMEKHNSFNNFLAKVNIVSSNPDALPQTRTSKNGLREGDKRLEKLFSWIRSKVPKPPRDSSFADHEIDLFQIMQQKFEKTRGNLAKAEGKTYSCHREMNVFQKSNNQSDRVRVDMFESIGDKNYVYEGKVDSTTSKDVYQLRMYWDGLIYDGITPTQGFLVAKQHPDSVLGLIDIVNTMEDANGNSYNLKAITWEDCDITQNR